MITIVNYGMGNLGSIRNMLKKLGAESVISADAEEITKARKLILPGVGAFDTGMERLRQNNLIEVLEQKALKEKVPVLGVCLGMQLMTKSSEEGTLPGLGWFDAHTVKFRFSPKVTGLKIPQMGWNFARPAREHQLFAGSRENPKFYFVHSYHVECENKGDEIGTTDYGYPFCSMIARDNLMATQFHPEKSHRFGMQLFSNFVKL